MVNDNRWDFSIIILDSRYHKLGSILWSLEIEGLVLVWCHHYQHHRHSLCYLRTT